MTFPGDEKFADMSLIGQCFLLGRHPFFYENWPFIEQIAFFSGWKHAHLDGYALRPYPAFLATWWTAAVGPTAALLIVNWLAWALCAWAAWRLSTKLFNDDLAALLSLVFVLGGMGPIFHIGDSNIHLPSFACYYLGVCLFYEKIIVASPKPLPIRSAGGALLTLLFVSRTRWLTHLTIGAFLAAVFLFYSWYAILLTAVYVLATLRYSRWYHIAGVVALALSAPLLWRIFLQSVGVELVRSEISLNLVPSIDFWWELLKNPSEEAALQFTDRLQGIGIFDSPVVLVVGLVSCLVLPTDRAVRWFGIFVLLMPVLAVLLVSPSCYNVPAYLTYGISIWIYCWLGRLFATGLRSRPAVCLAASLLLLVVLLTHFAWSTAHFSGWLGPVKTYIDGWQSGQRYFPNAPPIITSMTGLEDTPVLFGGKASLAAAGALISEARTRVQPDSVSWLTALQCQALLWGYLALLGALVAGALRRRLLVVLMILALAVVTSALSSSTFTAMPNYVNCLGPIWNNPHANESPAILSSAAKLSYRAELSPSFLDVLRREMTPDDQLSIFIGFPSPGIGRNLDRSSVQVSVAAGPLHIPTHANRWPIFSAIDPQEALAALIEVRCLAVEVTNYTASIPLAAWQRPDLPGRQTRITPVEQPSDENLALNSTTSSDEAEGFLQVPDDESITGWAWDPKQPNRPISVDIYDGDTKVATVPADRSRGDLLDAGIGNGAHAFHYFIPYRLRDGKTHTIRVRASGSQRELYDCPQTIQLDEPKQWQCCPAIEIRLMRPDGTIKVAGF
jgi:hypothetical protein